MNHCIVTLAAGLIILLSTLVPDLSAATFEILFPYGGPQGQKNVHVSDDGSIVLGSNRGVSHEAYIWERGKGITHQYTVYDGVTRYGMSGDGRTILACSYPCGLVPTDASFDGSVIAGAQNPFPFPTAVGIFNDQLINLGKLNGDNASIASAVTADGRTIVGESFFTQLVGVGYPIYRMEPFRWTADTGMVSLGTLPGAYITSANDVSGDGSVVVGRAHFSNIKQLAFRWTESAGMQSLGDLPGNFESSEAFAVSSDGRTIVGSGYTDRQTEAFLWTEAHGMRKLTDVLSTDHGIDVGEVYLRDATGVSADGRVIVGWGTDVTDRRFVWRVDLIPEPSSLVLSLIMLCSWCFSFRRRQ
jgi:probable HAF family extracellular repeat protein